LKKRYPHAIFRLLGPFDSNPAGIGAASIRQWKNEGLIEYLGETDDVRPFLSEASVYVLPSYREGTPRSVLEAMAMGRPIVTTDAPGCRETVVDGDNGFLVPIRDSPALAAAMEKFLVDPGLIVKMGKRSREIAEEKYDVRKVNAVIMKTMGLLDEKGF
jgi:glycosyltransferase involved in cell wall biosynthesis